MEAYKVWASLNLKGNAIVQMEKFLGITGKTNTAIKNLTRNLLPLNKELTLIADKLKLITPELRGLSTTFGKLSVNTLDSKKSLNSFNTSLSTSNRRVETLTRQTKRLSESLSFVDAKALASAESLNAMKGVGMGVGAGAIGRRRHFGSHHLKEFGMGGMSGSASTMGAASMGGAPLLAGAGVGILGYKGFEAQKEYQMKLSQLKALGFGDDYIKKSDQLATNTYIPGVGPTAMLEAIVDAQMATRAGPNQFNEVRMMAPELAKTALAMQITFGQAMTSKQQKDLISFAEIQGGSDPNKQLQWLRAASNMLITSGGRIAPNKQLQFAQLTSGSLNLTPEAYLAMEPVLQELQSRTGTGITTGARALVGAMTFTGFSKKNVKFWEKIGLLKGTFDKAGRPLGINMPDTYKEMFTHDPEKFFQQVIFPLLGKAGFKTDDQVHQALLTLPRTFSMVGWTTYKNMTKIDRARAMSHQVLSGDILQGEISKTPGFAVQQLSASWERFVLALGKASTPAIIFGLDRLTAFFNNLIYVGKFFDTIIKNPVINNMKKPTIGESLADRMFGNGAKTKDTQSQNNNVVINVDGKKLANALMPHLSNALNPAGAVSSTNSFNSSFSMPPVGLTNYGYQQ